ncbi:hypothetical protein OAO87_03185 [bacterium]|nr:hypothetical protein [bacterium]
MPSWYDGGKELSMQMAADIKDLHREDSQVKGARAAAALTKPAQRPADVHVYADGCACTRLVAFLGYIPHWTKCSKPDIAARLVRTASRP